MIKRQLRRQLQGFTLIEILIVVAIIAILASIILVGLGPTQSLGRDSRRLGDLHDVQNGLELYFNAKGWYVPAPAFAAANTWATFETTLTGAGININSVPDDPSSGKHYTYQDNGGGSPQSYVLEATLENGTGGEWANYTPPTNKGSMTSNYGSLSAVMTCTAATDQFCVTL